MSYEYHVNFYCSLKFPVKMYRWDILVEAVLNQKVRELFSLTKIMNAKTVIWCNKKAKKVGSTVPLRCRPNTPLSGSHFIRITNPMRSLAALCLSLKPFKKDVLQLQHSTSKHTTESLPFENYEKYK
ncbi:hypothetical protein WA026_012854 [Henosepilachna vigintioctopunctata]|uniref:Uncharacterized protein n=1 Tax=Henosepilachna vigintioctopunctata TaxID=420089 RepID=A0AAW1TK16_9CUCU